MAQPTMHAWSEAKQSLRLQELQMSKDDSDPKALCCYSVLDAHSKQIRLRFVDSRPVSQVTTGFLEWLCQQSADQGLGGSGATPQYVLPRCIRSVRYYKWVDNAIAIDK